MIAANQMIESYDDKGEILDERINACVASEPEQELVLLDPQEE